MVLKREDDSNAMGNRCCYGSSNLLYPFLLLYRISINILLDVHVSSLTNIKHTQSEVYRNSDLQG